MRTNKAHITWEDRLVEGALAEVVVADDWRICKHRVQGPDEAQKLLWLVVGKNGESDFERHALFSDGEQIHTEPGSSEQNSSEQN